MRKHLAGFSLFLTIALCSIFLANIYQGYFRRDTLFRNSFTGDNSSFAIGSSNEYCVAKRNPEKGMDSESNALIRSAVYDTETKLLITEFDEFDVSSQGNSRILDLLFYELNNDGIAQIVAIEEVPLRNSGGTSSIKLNEIDIESYGENLYVMTSSIDARGALISEFDQAKAVPIVVKH